MITCFAHTSNHALILQNKIITVIIPQYQITFNFIDETQSIISANSKTVYLSPFHLDFVHHYLTQNSKGQQQVNAQVKAKVNASATLLNLHKLVTVLLSS